MKPNTNTEAATTAQTTNVPAVSLPRLVLGSSLCWDCEHNRVSTCPYEPDRPTASCGAWFTNAAVEYGDSPLKKAAIRELLAREVSTGVSLKTPEERTGFPEKTDEEKWRDHFVLPIAAEMKRRGIGEMRIKLTEKGTAVFELLPENSQAHGRN